MTELDDFEKMVLSAMRRAKPDEQVVFRRMPWGRAVDFPEGDTTQTNDHGMME